MNKIKEGAKNGGLALLGNLAPVLVFYLVNHFYGLRPAVVTTIIFTVGEVIRLRVKKKPINKLFVFSVVLTLIFSTLDLIFAKGLFVRLEPVVTNIVSAGLFGYMAYSPGMLIEAIRQTGREDAFNNPDQLFIIRANLALWVIYFLGKSAVYFQYNMTHSIEKTIVFRTVVGNASLVGMAIVSIIFMKLVAMLGYRFRLMPSQKNQ